YEDARAPEAEHLGFVLHLGDFIYELVWYPEDRPKGYYARKIRDIVRYPKGMKIADYHVPVDLNDYRAVWRAYLADPDLQDARARWPFVAMWDNHEFSFQGWQSIVQVGKFVQPGQSVKVAANQAWFEYLPARVKAPSGSLDAFGPPDVKNVKIETFDENGLGTEPNNLIAINSLKGYRALRWGKHLDLIITDQHSYRGPDPFSDPALDKLGPWGEYQGMFPDELQQVLDGGRAFNGGNPPAELRFKDARVPNSQKDAPPQTILGAEQRAWFKDQLKRATATWKIWGNSQSAFQQRADPENLPPGLMKEAWPAGSFGNLGNSDFGNAYIERNEIYDLVRDSKITGFAIVSGDLHSFWAGYASAELPPGKFEPIGLSFVGGSLTSPGAAEGNEYTLPKDLPLRPLFIADRPNGEPPDCTLDMLMRHGVRSCLEYAKTFDLARARALSNPALAPHVEFIDMGGHGYATVRLSADEMRTEFVCIPRPVTRSESPDGGPLRYRVVHTAKLWRPGERPQLTQHVLEGDVGLSI
ncbi:MAG: alkaline phosphatase D family protein, partial [Deltaproteobacteria bacterium]|nr:alkaline phosphatase D family protein [Deltaproteobacteria bacterium]